MSKKEKIRKEAFVKFEKEIAKLSQAVHEGDYQKQLIALSKATDHLQEARLITAALCGGMLN